MHLAPSLAAPWMLVVVRGAHRMRGCGLLSSGPGVLAPLQPWPMSSLVGSLSRYFRVAEAALIGCRGRLSRPVGLFGRLPPGPCIGFQAGEVAGSRTFDAKNGKTWHGILFDQNSRRQIRVLLPAVTVTGNSQLPSRKRASSLLYITCNLPSAAAPKPPS